MPLIRRDSLHLPQVLVAELAGSQEQHQQQISDHHPPDQDESIGRRQRVSLRSHLLAQNSSTARCCASSGPVDPGSNPAAQHPHPFVGKPTAGLHVEPQQVGMKLLPHRNEAGHNSYADLAAENANKVHESGECGGIGGAGQSARFEPFQNDAADQADVCAREPGREQKLDDLEAVSCPRSIEVCTDPAAHRAQVSPTARISREFV